MQVTSNSVSSDNTRFEEDDSLGMNLVNDASTNEDDWQFL
jgi:cysteine protease ATG4